jgi:hypothetical protein
VDSLNLVLGRSAVLRRALCRRRITSEICCAEIATVLSNVTGQLEMVDQMVPPIGSAAAGVDKQGTCERGIDGRSSRRERGSERIGARKSTTKCNNMSHIRTIPANTAIIVPSGGQHMQGRQASITRDVFVHRRLLIREPVSAVGVETQLRFLTLWRLE